MLYDWEQDPPPLGVTVATLTSETKSAIDDSQDLRGIGSPWMPAFWYASDVPNLKHIFRMDLRGAPTTGAGQSAAQYTLQVDSIPGQGANPGQHPYVATGGPGISGIDQVVAADFSETAGFTGVYLYQWNPYTGTFDDGIDILGPTINGQVDPTENGGKTLQLAIPFNRLGGSGPFQFSAATMNFGTGTTYDIVGIINMGMNSIVPEPSSLALAAFGLTGIVAMIVRRRKGV
jgi:hypothetical protein